MFRLNIKEIATNVALVDTDDDHNWCVPTDRKITCETYVKKQIMTSDSCMPDYPPFQKDPETFPRQTSQTDH